MVLIVLRLLAKTFVSQKVKFVYFYSALKQNSLLDSHLSLLLNHLYISNLFR